MEGGGRYGRGGRLGGFEGVSWARPRQRVKGGMDGRRVRLPIDHGPLPRATTDPAELPLARTQRCVREGSTAPVARATAGINPAHSQGPIEHRFDRSLE